MKALLSKEMVFSRGSLEFLGNCVVAQTACYFLRLDGHDIMLAARIRSDSSTRTFARGKHLDFEYRSAGPEPLSAPSTAVLEGFTLRLLRQEARIAETLRSPPGSLEETTGISLMDSAQDESGERFDLQIAATQLPISVVVGPRGSYPLPLFRWSFRVKTEDSVPPAVSGAIQHFLLLVCAHRILEEPFQFNPGIRPIPALPRREVFAYYAPGKPDHPAPRLPELQAGDRLRISFEVPSRCTQRCVFCVAWSSCHDHLKPLDQQDLEAAATDLLADLSAAAGTVSADVVLVGQDALTHPGFPALVRLFRSHELVQRITVVTPGTGLAGPELVAELAEAGLDGVILTLLGATALLHDRLAGREQAHADFLLSTINLAAAGLDWELNTVVLKDNLESFPELLAYSSRLDRKVRVYLYTNEPIVPLTQVALCAPDLGEFAALLANHRGLVEAHVESIHYAPLCRLPRWAWHLSGHASQSLPSPAVPLPDACQGCAALGTRCPSVSAAFVSLFGTAGLVHLDSVEE